MTGRPRLVIRADGGPGIGSGHLGRCLALVQAWRDHHGEAVLVSAQLPEMWRRRYVDEGVTIVDPGDADGLQADWWVLDGYQFDGGDVDTARRYGDLVLAIVDHFDARVHAQMRADLFLDQNLPQPGAEVDGPAEVLRGPRYALLRRELRQRLLDEVVSDPADRGAPVRTLLVSKGGDPTPATEALFEGVLADARLGAIETLALEGQEDVGTMLAAADVALSCGGSTAYELCAFGVPTVLVARAVNQEPGCLALEAAGAALNASYPADMPEQVADQLSVLVGQPELRVSLAEHARKLVDGEGAVRVVTRMRSLMLKIRAACEDDAELLWKWANDAEVRRWSFNPEPIPWESHVQWFRSALDRPTTAIYVVSDGGGRAIGQVRFDIDSDGSALIGASLDGDHRGLGLGGAAMDAAVRALFDDYDCSLVVARVLEDNIPSVRAVLGADFDLSTMNDGPSNSVRLTRTR